MIQQKYDYISSLLPNWYNIKIVNSKKYNYVNALIIYFKFIPESADSYRIAIVSFSIWILKETNTLIIPIKYLIIVTL